MVNAPDVAKLMSRTAWTMKLNAICANPARLAEAHCNHHIPRGSIAGITHVRSRNLTLFTYVEYHQ